MEQMEKLEGGIIQDCFPFPRLPPRIVVVGNWSGFVWAPGRPEISVQQFRNGVVVESWKLAGIEIMSRVSRDALLILRRVNSVSKESDAKVIKPGDLIVLGEGGKYSEFLIEAINLTANHDCSIELEVEKQRYKGVALYEQGKFSRMVVFHPDNLKLAPRKECVIWWHDKPFKAQLVVGENLTSDNLYLKTKSSNLFPASVELVSEPLLARPALG